jgi:hypothetical protein
MYILHTDRDRRSEMETDVRGVGRQRDVGTRGQKEIERSRDRECERERERERERGV